MQAGWRMARGFDDRAAIVAMAEGLAAWDPALGLEVLESSSCLYDGAATTYALALAGGSRLRTRLREEVLGAGDLVVAPAELALDVEPPGPFLRIVHHGQPPRHFRERFVQTRGFDRIALGELPAGVSAARGGYRLTAVCEAPGSVPRGLRAEPWEHVLLVALREPARVEWGAGDGSRHELAGCLVQGIGGGGLSYRSDGLVVRLTMVPEMMLREA
jgi:hypothetical protein